MSAAKERKAARRPLPEPRQEKVLSEVDQAMARVLRDYGGDLTGFFADIANLQQRERKDREGHAGTTAEHGLPREPG